MQQIPREIIEQILNATDIVELIGSYIPVKRAGSRYQALCPFHQEKTASFSIDPARQFFHCFGCQKSGDAISFIREYEGLTFSDAVRKLGDRVGITIAVQSASPKEEADRRRRGQLLDLHRTLTQYYHQQLLEAPEAEHARQYLAKRKFNAETIQQWRLGWAPPEKQFIAWAKKNSIRGRDLVDAGIAKQNQSRGLYFYFRDRLMFPIANHYGDVIGFSARLLAPNPREGKYVNTPETRLFKKSHVLFGLDQARKSILDRNHALICEGQIDAIVCHAHGITQAIAPLGTAFPEHHAITLRRYTKTALLCYDSDAAGHKAIRSVFAILAAAGIAVKVVNIPPGEDPDSFIQSNGFEAFQKLLDNAVNYFDFQIQLTTEKEDLNDPLVKSTFLQDIASQLALISDKLTREAMVQHLATKLRLGAPEILAATNQAARKSAYRKSYDNRLRKEDDPHAAQAKIVPLALDTCIGALCSLALRSNEVANWLGEQFETIHELKSYLKGVELLQKILSARPDPNSNAAINSFLASLSQEEQLALHNEPSFQESLPENPFRAAEHTLADASALALEKEDVKINATLASSELSFEEQLELLQRTKEIAVLLQNLPNRAIKTDRYSANTPLFRKPRKK